MAPDGVFLDHALEAARARVKRDQAAVPARLLEQRCAAREAPPSFAAALRRGAGEGIRIIAEIKPASPSAGTLSGKVSVEKLARAYEHGGAAAISVLTDPDFFSGELAYLDQAGRVTSLPLLRKDFIVSPYQVLEARCRGASSLLLLVAALEDKELRALMSLCRELDMEPLVEVHDQREVERALRADARVVAVNNRDLRTLQVDPETTLRLKSYIPPRPYRSGGERLFRPSPGVASRTSRGGRATGGRDPDAFVRPRRGHPRPAGRTGLARAPAVGTDGRYIVFLKVCGVTRAADAVVAARLGFNAIGMIFAESPPAGGARPGPRHRALRPGRAAQGGSVRQRRAARG